MNKKEATQFLLSKIEADMAQRGINSETLIKNNPYPVSRRSIFYAKGGKSWNAGTIIEVGKFFNLTITYNENFTIS